MNRSCAWKAPKMIHPRYHAQLGLGHMRPLGRAGCTWLPPAGQPWCVVRVGFGWPRHMRIQGPATVWWCALRTRPLALASFQCTLDWLTSEVCDACLRQHNGWLHFARLQRPGYWRSTSVPKMQDRIHATFSVPLETKNVQRMQKEIWM